MMNSEFKIKDGVLIRYLGSAKHVVIPDGITRIAGRAFEGCKSLQSVEEIGQDAFYSCLMMKDLVILGRKTRMENCGAGYGTFLDYNLYDGYFEHSGKVIDDFTIHCRRKSLAEKYAHKHRFLINYI